MSAFCDVAHYVQAYQRRRLKDMMTAQCSMTPQCHTEGVNVMSKQIEVVTVTPNSVTSLRQSASGVSHLEREVKNPAHC